MAEDNRGISLFGFEIKRKNSEKEEEKKVSFVPSADESDGGYVVDAGGHYGAYVDMEGGRARNDKDLILKYRDIASQPECDMAIDDIISEAVVSDEDSAPVDIILDDLDQSDKVKKLIREEFEYVIQLLNMNWNGHEIFRRWYVDGRLFYHKIIDDKNPKNGIIDLRPIDSTRIRKVKEIIKDKDPVTGANIVKGMHEYYIYENQGIGGASNTMSASVAGTGLKIAKDSITYVTSGLLDPTRTQVHSYLHKALKPVNQLRMLEDSLVIYRLSRAPERRIFYIDVGNLPKGKAEEYLRNIMSRYRNKMTYDASTGDLKDDKKHMNMLEDFWLPRREGGRGTEITTLPGGENLGQIDDILYFQKKVYKALNVPISRLDPEQQAMVSLGRTTETTRDELKFQRFISRLRKRFSALFMDILKTQLILKGICTEEEWNDISQDISVDFLKDSYFSELKEAEIFRERIASLREVDEYVGRYYSVDWVRKNILMQNDEDIEQMIKDIDTEGSAPDEDDFMEEETITPDQEFKEVPEEPISEERNKELEESQLRLIQSMTKILDE